MTIPSNPPQLGICGLVINMTSPFLGVILPTSKNAKLNRETVNRQYCLFYPSITRPFVHFSVFLACRIKRLVELFASLVSFFAWPSLSNLLSFVIRAICGAQSVAAMFITFEQQGCQRIVKCTLSFDNRVFACLYRHGNLRDHIELFLQFAGKLSELLIPNFCRCNCSRVSAPEAQKPLPGEKRE